MPSTTETFEKLKVKGEFKPRVYNFVFRLHYRWTVLIYMIGSILSAGYDFVGDKISCLTPADDDELEAMMNSFCYITGTYTVNQLHHPQAKYEPAYPGVGVSTKDPETTRHTYYQWVSIVLFVQGTLFYLPHYLWKGWESGIFTSLIRHLSVRDYLEKTDDYNFNDRANLYKGMSEYIRACKHPHRKWAVKFIFCELLNVATSVFTLFFTNFFLGGEFFTYGTEMFTLSAENPENRTDPMSKVFPKMGKCDFKLYGPSGTVQTFDVMCLLPTNIANEKIFIVLWVWLMFLITAGATWFLYHLVSLIRPIRTRILMNRVHTVEHQEYTTIADDEEKLPAPEEKSLVPEEKSLFSEEELPAPEEKKKLPVPATRDQVRCVLRKSDFSDYFLLSQLADSMDAVVFSEFLAQLASDYDYRPPARSENQAKTSLLTDSGVDEDEPEDLALKKEKEAQSGGIYPPLDSISNAPFTTTAT